MNLLSVSLYCLPGFHYMLFSLIKITEKRVFLAINRENGAEGNNLR